MKRASIVFSGMLFLIVLTATKSFAQSDDVYYDAGSDKNSAGSSQDYNGNQNNNDGYRMKGSKSYVDSNGNTYVTNNYYEDADYSSRLERFYGPSCGFGYYDYLYTPAYYWGWGGAGFGVGFGYPYYGSYWGWNWGWGLAGYYNPWYSPFGICGYYGWRSSWLYGSGYGRGRWSPYGRGYGYGAYASNGYANNGFYFGPRHENLVNARNINRSYVASSVGHLQPGLSSPTGRGNGNSEIPREGVAKASNNGNRVNANSRPANESANKAEGWKSVPPSGWNNNKAASSANSNRSERSQQHQQQRSQNYNGNSSPQRGGSGQVSSDPRSANRGGGSSAAAQNRGSYQSKGGSSSAPSYHGNSGSSYRGNGGGASRGSSGGSFHGSSSGGGGGSHGSSGGSHGGGGGGRH